MIKVKDFNPARLKNARLYRGKTLDVLANDTKINKKDITAFEESKYLPTLENSAKLARGLNFPQEYLYSKDNMKVIVENTHISVPGRIPRVEEVACREKLIMIHKLATFIEEQVKLPKLNLPGNEYRNLDIEQLADKTRECFNLDEKPIKNIIDLMESNGILVSDINVNKRGAVAITQKQSIDKNIKYVVCIGNDNNSLSRRNYEMAYELAYIVSNNLGIAPKRFSKDDFAAAFLLPKEAFFKDLDNVENLNDYLELKKKWNVEVAVMLFRANQIGVLSYKKYNSLMQEMNKKGWLNKEPLEDSIKAKEPKLLKNAIKLVSEKTDIIEDLSDIGIDMYAEDIELLVGLKNGSLN